MSTVEEIEHAIEKLRPRDIHRVARWLSRYQKEIAKEREERKIAAIRATAGCLTGEEGEDFAKAVEKAGNGPMEDHAW
ncbi:hypothetical protein N9Z02_01420 [Akkermansiaceae bacterium]|nr:hypothetical protein [Akkermansiaceae bacterium]